MNLTVNCSPHIKSKDTTRRIMLDVAIALLPAFAVGVWQFGIRALAVAVVTIASSVLAELIYGVLVKRRVTVFDASAVVTGLLLAMTLPATVPYWSAAVGGVFAVIVVKAMCGGLGQNVFNPALAGRAFLMLICPLGLTRFAASGAEISLTASTVDMMTSATPLHHMVMPALPEVSLLDAFMGNMVGCIGEVSTLALLIGGAYLVCRKVISLRIPLAYLGTVAVLTLIFHRTGDPIGWMLYSLLSGGVVLGAIFMATDYATSPVTPIGQILYGIGCGALTVLFRYFGLFPEGVTYAILLMNACVWAIDQFTAPRCFGAQKGDKA